MAKWKRSGLDAIREYEASSSYAKNIGAAQVTQQDRPNEKKWKRSGLDAIREYEASSNFPKTVAVRKYNAADREYNPSGTPALQKPKSQQHAQAAQEQRQKEQRRRNQLAVAAAAGAQADALQQSYYSYKQAGAPQAAQDAAYQNYAWARHQQDELNRANAMGRQLDPKEMQRLTTVRYRSPAQAAAQETAKNTPAAKNREWADERTKKRQEQLSEQEFNRSSAMQKQYGSYNNYLRGVYAGYDEAVAKREAEQAKTSEDLRAESDALQTQIDELSDKLKTAYQNPSAENYKNFMELQQQWREARKQKKEVDKRVSEKQTEERRAQQQAAQEAAQEKYDGWSEERMQGRLDELNRQINLALARSDGTADVSALKTEREALEEEKRRAYPTEGQKALNYLEDANDALMLAGTAQAMTGYEQTHAFAEAAANRAAAWALRDIANSEILRELGGEKYAEKLQSLADKMAVDVDYTGAQQWQEEYQRIMDEATKDHSGAGKWILEQLPSAGAMVVDQGMAGLFGVNAGTGAMNVTPLTMMGIRAGGSAALDAKNEGATDAQAALIGLENAAVEIFSEKLFGGNPLYDEDVGLVNKAVSKLTNSKTVMKVLDSKAFDFVSEGLEEVVAELLEPTFQSMVLHGTLDGATNAENIGNAFLGGVFLAALGKVAGAPAGLTQAQNERKAQQYAQVMSRIGMQSENAEVRAAAEAMQEKLDYGRTPDEADFGRLVNAMDASGDMGAATEAVENAQQERQNQPETLGHYETMLVRAGIGVESAKSRVDVMERLVRGETVSDAELKKIQMGSKLSKQMLYEMSGVEIPEGITSDRDLMAYYRMAYESAQERASGESARTAAQEAEQTTPEEQSVPAENTDTPQAAGAPDEQKKTPKKPEVRAPEQSLQDARAMRDGGAAEADVLDQTGWIPLSSDSYLNPKTGEQVYFDGETVTVWQNGRGAQNAAQSNADAPVQEAENVQQAEAYAQETQGAASAENTANGQAAQEAPKSENSKPGLTMDEYVQTMLDNETAGKIDTVAKALGVNVRFVDAVEGGRANAQISGRQVLVEKNNRNPVMFLLGHEWTHRMQDAAPEQYRTFREAIMDEIRPQAQAVMENYARQGYEITEEAALDEAAADYAGRMIDDSTVLDEFIEKHRDDRTLLQKIADALRELIRKLTGAERKKAETAEGKLLAAMDAAAENTKTAASDGGTRYSAKSGNEGREATQAEITTRYQQSVHDILNGASSTSDALLVGYTPEVYQKLGMPDLPFVVGSGHVYSMAKTADEASAEGKFHKGVNYHGLGENVVADILDFVKDPVMVISAKDVDAKTTPMRSTHSVVALIDVGTGKESMVIPVAITAERTVNGMRMDVNAISSAYEKNTAGLVNEAIAQFNAGENSVFYVKKGAANLLGAGVQFPEQLKAAASSDGILRKFDSKINMSVQNVTESKQFKNWFGDWQNHPESASKVVNADGTPKVVYHGTGAEFWTFDLNQSGKNYGDTSEGFFFFTNKRNGYQDSALDYARESAKQSGKPRVVEAYLDIRNPLRLDSNGYYTPTAYYDANASKIYDQYLNGDYDGVIIENRDKSKDDSIIYLLDDAAKIKSATDNVGTFDRNNPDIRYSLKETTAEERKQHDNDALSYFGKTYKWSETGYVLLDGSKLDFSGRHEGGPGGYRTVDHRDIVDALGEDYGGGDYSGGMVQFMQEGNIRISPESGGINLAVMPTKAQMVSLSDFISKERGAVILDIDDANGDTISSTEYPRGTHANRVLQDIRNYFNEGITPEVSSTPTVSQFRDSLKGAEVSREYADVLKENELLKERVDYWKGQTKQTARVTTDAKAVSQEAKDLVRRYGAEMDAGGITEALQGLYDAMAYGELDGQEAFEKAREIAGELVENAVETDDELYRNYKDLRDFLRTTKLTISEADSKDLVDVAALRKSNFGRMIVGKGQTNVDQVYQEIAEQWPEFFDENEYAHPADQLQQISDVLNSLYTITEQNPYQGYIEQAKTAAANEILDDFFRLPQTKKTFADRQAEALSEAKARGREQVQKVREQKNAQLADLREKNKDRVNKLLEKERDRQAKQIAKLKEQYKSRDAAAKDRRSVRELRNKIVRHTKNLSQKLLRPTDKQHIPEILKHEVAAMLESINMEDNYTLDPATIREGKVGKDGKTTLYGEKLRGADRNEKGVMTRRSEAFAALKAKYTQIVKDGDAMTVDPYLLGNNAEGIRGGFDEVIDMKDTPLADLSKSQLQTMWNVVRAVEHSVSTYGKMLSNVKFTETQNWADALKRDTKSRRERTGGLLLDFETPYTFFSHYGDAGTSIYRMLRDAQDQQQLMVNDVTEQTQKIVDPKTVKELEKQTHTFKLASGKELTLSTAQVMDLYNLMQRKQAYDHLIKGGVIQPEIKDRKIRRGTESLRLTEADLANIAGSLTEEQTKIAQSLQKLTSGVLADYGNEASMRAYGYKKFTEQNYWPIKSAKEGIYSNVEKGGNQDRSIKNIGMAKQTTPEAGNALEISSIFDTFSNHASDMTDYAAWLCAMEDANRLFNFRFKDGAGNLTGETIRGLLEKYGGKGAQSYWTKLMGDIQNGINTKEFTPATQAATKLIGGFKGAAVGGNIRVVIQQPTAFFRASAVLSPLDMARGLAGGVTKGGGWKRALEYSPIAMRKDNGSFDISAPYTMKQTLFDNRDAIRKVNDFLSAPAGAADAITWGRLWNACEWAVKRGYPNLKPGSKAFYEQTARQFAEVIDQTQVVDGVLQRSNIMRAKNEITKQATSFKGEPIMSINLLVRTIDAFTHETSKEKKSAAAKKIGRAAAALLVTDVVNAFAQSIIDGIRDDDKDKKWWKRVMSAFTGQTGEEETAWEKGWNFVMEGNLGGNLNKAASMPYLADVFSLMQGYEVARTDTEVINDIVRASQTLIKSLGDGGKKTWVYATKATLGATAKLFGLPLNNLTRDLWGVLRSVAIETDNIPLQYEMEKMIWNIDNHSNSGKFGELLYKSLTLGDTEAYQKIRGEMQKRMGLDDSRIKSILRGHVKDDYTGGKMTQDEAITFLVKHGIEKDKDAAFWKIQEWDSGDEEDYTKFGELSDAVLNGGKSSTGATVDELVEWYVEHGTKRSAVQSGITSAVHEAYKDGTIDEEAVADLLKQYQAYDEGEKGYQTDDDIYWTVREWTAQYNGDEDYHKYDSVYEVVENGGDLKDVIREYTENGTEEKTIASALTSHYKPLYIAASASERKKMKEYLAKAYAALGRDKEKARKDIDKWLEE